MFGVLDPGGQLIFGVHQSILYVFGARGSPVGKRSMLMIFDVKVSGGSRIPPPI